MLEDFRLRLGNGGADHHNGVAKARKHLSDVDQDTACTDFLKRLLEVNANRVIGDLDDRILESRRGAEGTLRRRLAGLVATASEALERSERLREQGEGCGPASSNSTGGAVSLKACSRGRVKPRSRWAFSASARRSRRLRPDYPIVEIRSCDGQASLAVSRASAPLRALTVPRL